MRPGGLALTDSLLAHCDLPSGALVLDAGCGTGTTVRHLRIERGLRAIGVDLSDLLLRQGQNDETPLCRGDLGQLPLRDTTCAAVLCECVLSLLERPEQALAEFRRVLAPDGYLLLSDIYLRSGTSAPAVEEGLKHCCLVGAVGWEQLVERVCAAGFRVLHTEDRTRQLLELAARLAFAGLTPLEGVLLAGEQCGGTVRNRWGYGLLVACKDNKGGVAHE